MTNQRLIRFGLNGIAGFLSFAMLGYGLYSAMGTDIRFNPVPSILYYALPICCLPVFFLGFIWRKAVILQAILAIAYLIVCAVLSWRQCSSLGYCTSVAHVVLLNLETRPVLTFFAVAIASSAAMILRNGSSGRAETR